MNLTDLPAWLPKPVASQLAAWLAAGNRALRFTFSKGERRIFRRRAPIAVSLWAEKNRVLNNFSSIPGNWQNLFTPYLAGIMDAAVMPGVETVIICKAPQTGGTEAAHNLVGWSMDYAAGPVMYVYPDENTARENARDRIIPMITLSPHLREYLTGACDDVSSLRISLMHMPIYLGWSGSVSRLGNKPIRTLVLDELDKYKDPKNEATSEALAEQRTITWKSRKRIIKISTPTTETGPIWRAFSEEAHARFDYWTRCPACGVYHLMQFERLIWPGKDTDKEAAGEEVLAGRLAAYSCPHCGAVWDDADRDRAVRAGEWRERETGLTPPAHIASKKPVKIAFHLPAWLSYFISLSKVAAIYLKAKSSGLMKDWQEFQNQYCALPYTPEIAERQEDAILALCDDRPRGAVPGPVDGKPRVACLLAGVDTQGKNEIKGYFRYVIRAFGFGDSEESWLIQASPAPSFEALNEILWRSAYRSPDGGIHVVRGCMIDAMGCRTSEVYRWAVANRGRVFPWQGVQHMTQPYSPSAQEYVTDIRGNKIKIPGGMNLWRCDTTFFKSDLSAKLAIAPDDPGAFHLHANDGSILEQYAREMCAEIWDTEKHAWINPSRRPNHFWDCEVMCLALAYILNVRHIPLPGNETKPRPKKETSRAAMRQTVRGTDSLEARLGRLRG